MELEVTWNRAIRVWWSYVWRNLIAIAVGAVIGMIVGLIIGFVMGSMGFSMLATQLVIIPLCFVIGLALSVVPMKMILRKDFGEFRLVLLAK